MRTKRQAEGRASAPGVVRRIREAASEGTGQTIGTIADRWTKLRAPRLTCHRGRVRRTSATFGRTSCRRSGPAAHRADRQAGRRSVTVAPSSPQLLPQHPHDARWSHLGRRHRRGWLTSPADPGRTVPDFPRQAWEQRVPRLTSLADVRPCWTARPCRSTRCQVRLVLTLASRRMGLRWRPGTAWLCVWKVEARHRDAAAVCHGRPRLKTDATGAPQTAPVAVACRPLRPQYWAPLVGHAPARDDFIVRRQRRVGCRPKSAFAAPRRTVPACPRTSRAARLTFTRFVGPSPPTWPNGVPADGQLLGPLRKGRRGAHYVAAMAGQLRDDAPNQAVLDTWRTRGLVQDLVRTAGKRAKAETWR